MIHKTIHHERTAARYKLTRGLHSAIPGSLLSSSRADIPDTWRRSNANANPSTAVYRHPAAEMPLAHVCLVRRANTTRGWIERAHLNLLPHSPARPPHLSERDCSLVRMRVCENARVFGRREQQLLVATQSTKRKKSGRIQRRRLTGCFGVRQQQQTVRLPLILFRGTSAARPYLESADYFL